MQGDEEVSVPKYQHDCTSCVFLGGYVKPGSGTHCDLYYCSKCDEGTVIARVGSDGPDYASVPINVLLYAGYHSDHPLIEAARRQIKRWQGIGIEESCSYDCTSCHPEGY